MEKILDTNFEIPEEVVLNFIKSANLLCKRCPIGPKGDTEKCREETLQLIHFYTYLKYQPYSNHRGGLNKIKNIKEIDSILSQDKREVKILTKKNQSIIPACKFVLNYKSNKWKISNVLIKQGTNNYYSLFVS